VAIERRMCLNHPGRPAIGVCVITRQAICAECSTRYEGVNYSREGLRVLQEQRKVAEARSPMGTLVSVLMVLLSPLMLLMMYLFYSVAVEAVMTIVHPPGQG
jgi:hypothetical protein